MLLNEPSSLRKQQQQQPSILPPLSTNAAPSLMMISPRASRIKSSNPSSSSRTSSSSSLSSPSPKAEIESFSPTSSATMMMLQQGNTVIDAQSYSDTDIDSGGKNNKTICDADNDSDDDNDDKDSTTDDQAMLQLAASLKEQVEGLQQKHSSAISLHDQTKSVFNQLLHTDYHSCLADASKLSKQDYEHLRRLQFDFESLRERASIQEQQKAILSNAVMQLQQEQEAASSSSVELEIITSENQRLKKKIEELQKRSERQTERNISLDTSLSKCRQQHIEIKHQLDLSQEQVDQLQRKCRELKSALSSSRSQRKTKSKSKASSSSSSSSSTPASSIASLTRQVQRLKDINQSLEQARQNDQITISQLERKLANLKGSMRSVTKERDQLRQYARGMKNAMMTSPPSSARRQQVAQQMATGEKNSYLFAMIDQEMSGLMRNCKKI